MLKRNYQWLLLLCALLVACATISPSAQIDFAYTSVNAYVDSTKQLLARGRITKDQATQAADNADKALKKIAEARLVLSGCKGQPCANFTTIMNGLQPNLLALERDLRAKEQAK